MMKFVRSWIRSRAMRTGKGRGLYLRLCRPSGFEWAEYLRRHGGFVGIGPRCSILPSTLFTDPHLVRIGENVHFATATIVGHDGSVGMMEAAYGVRHDGTGKVDIRDNVFIGHQAVIMPGTVIGPDAIVAAGSVVTRDVSRDTIVAGVPARPIGKVSDLVPKRDAELDALPWAEKIRTRGGWDAALEAELDQARRRHFFPDA